MGKKACKKNKACVIKRRGSKGPCTLVTMAGRRKGSLPPRLPPTNKKKQGKASAAKALAEEYRADALKCSKPERRAFLRRQAEYCSAYAAVALEGGRARVDHEARRRVLKGHDVPLLIGEVPGVDPGTLFHGRAAAYVAGVITETIQGIAACRGVCNAVVVSGGYADDSCNFPAEFIYTGKGGNAYLSDGRQIADQTLDDGIHPSDPRCATLLMWLECFLIHDLFSLLSNHSPCCSQKPRTEGGSRAEDKRAGAGGGTG